MTNGKVSVSFPRDLLKRLEKQRRRRGWSRSEAVQFAVDQWLRSMDIEKDEADYIAGYVRLPDDVREGEMLLKAQADGLEREDWA